MHKFLIAFSAICFLFCAPAANAAAIALADADYLMNEAAAAKNIKQQLKTQREQFKKDFKTTEAVLRKEEKALVEKRQNLTEAEFKKQIGIFQKKMSDEQKKFEKKKSGLDKGFSDALKELQKEIGIVIQEVAKEQKIDFVISKQSALFAAAGQPDITSEVLKRMNARKSTIKVKF